MAVGKSSSSKDGGGVGMRRDSGLKFGSEAGAVARGLKFTSCGSEGVGGCGRTVGEGCDVGGARRVECDERSAGDRGANRRRNLPCAQHQHTTLLSHRSGRSVKGFLSGNAQRQSKGRGRATWGTGAGRAGRPWLRTEHELAVAACEHGRFPRRDHRLRSDPHLTPRHRVRNQATTRRWLARLGRRVGGWGVGERGRWVRG